jgi:hypothetical protein
MEIEGEARENGAFIFKKLGYNKSMNELLECLSYQIAVFINNILLFREIVEDEELFEEFRENTLKRGLRIEELKQKIKELEEKLREKIKKHKSKTAFQWALLFWGKLD